MVLDGPRRGRCGAEVRAGPDSAPVAKGPAGARFIAPDADGRARILAKHAFLKR